MPLTTPTGARNYYLYDAEGRICAVASPELPGIQGAWVLTGYLYEADGTRVTKGTITQWSCDPTVSGFQTSQDSILGPGPGTEQMTEVDKSGASMVWEHTNVWAAGRLIATYDTSGNSTDGSFSNVGLHFYLNDPLGTRRTQTDYAGVREQTCQSLPYGDALSCSGTAQDPTAHHFTSKERDTESGNDYFGARYYASTVGRFMSPDWSAKIMPVPYATMGDPQSLNLYAYVRNNPLSGIDADGHDCTGTESEKCDPGANNSWKSTAWRAQDALQMGDDDALLAAMAGYQPAQQQSGNATVPVVVGQRPLQNKFLLFLSLGLAKHSYYIVEGHRFEVLGDANVGWLEGLKTQEVRDTTGTSRAVVGKEHTVMVSQAQADALYNRSETYISSPCPVCHGGQEGYNLFTHNSNSFVYNMLNSDPAGPINPGTAPAITPGWARRPDDWY